MNNFLTRGVIAADACESNNNSLFSTSEMYLYEMMGCTPIAASLFYKFFKGTIAKLCMRFGTEDFTPLYDYISEKETREALNLRSGQLLNIKRRLTAFDELYKLGYTKYVKMFDDGVLVISQGDDSMSAVYCGNGDVDEVRKFLMENTEEIVSQKEENKISYQLVRVDSSGFTTTNLEMDDMHIDIAKNYNDDFDYERLKNLQLADNPSLTLLHGKPGTGKTTILKQLIKDIGDKKEVYYMDCNLLTSFSDGDFMNFVTAYLRGNVLILEDCEKALMDRGSGNNPIITTILNMTDGFLAASIKPHFICTFNCPLSRIDRALLRKGRLSFRYEFGDLSLEKCKAINPLADSPMPLSELYNMEEVVCAQSRSSKIGF